MQATEFRLNFKLDENTSDFIPKVVKGDVLDYVEGISVRSNGHSRTEVQASTDNGMLIAQHSCRFQPSQGDSIIWFEFSGGSSHKVYGMAIQRSEDNARQKT